MPSVTEQCGPFSVELGRVAAALKKARARRVLLQVPEGLKPCAARLAARLEQAAGVEAVVFTDPCFGACDLPLHARRLLACDFIVHVGHTPFMKAARVLYAQAVPRVSRAALERTAREAARALTARGARRVGVLCTASFLGHAARFCRLLEEKGFAVRRARGKRTLPMQLLGCDQRAAAAVEKEVDAFVFLSDGVFHPVGVALAVSKPLWLADPAAARVRLFSKKESERFVRRRAAAIARAQRARTFGVLVTTKAGQLRLAQALRVKRLLEKHGRKALVLAGDLITEAALEGIKVDAFVSTACPRIAVDDGVHWKKPVLNPLELEVALGEKPFSSLQAPMDF